MTTFTARLVSITFTARLVSITKFDIYGYKSTIILNNNKWIIKKFI